MITAQKNKARITESFFKIKALQVQCFVFVQLSYNKECIRNKDLE